MYFGCKASYLVSQSFFSPSANTNIEPCGHWLWHPVQYNTVPATALLYSLYWTRLKPCMGGLIQISQRVFWPRASCKIINISEKKKCVFGNALSSPSKFYKKTMWLSPGLLVKRSFRFTEAKSILKHPPASVTMLQRIVKHTATGKTQVNISKFCYMSLRIPADVSRLHWSD